MANDGELLGSAERIWLRREARAALSAFGLASTTRTRLIKHQENTVLKVLPVRGSPMVLRMHRPGYHSGPEIRSELAWLAALAESRLAVPVPAHGALVDQPVCIDVGRGERSCVLFDWVDGTHLRPRDLIPVAADIGRLIGQLHVQAESWVPEPWFSRKSWDSVGLTGPSSIWGDFTVPAGYGPSARRVLQTLRNELRRRLADFGQSTDRYGLIHADFNSRNVLRSGGGLRIIDFDDCGPGWFLYDIACVVAGYEHRNDFDEVLDLLIAGYREERALADAELEELWTFVLCRRLASLGWLQSRPETKLARHLADFLIGSTLDLARKYRRGVLRPPATPRVIATSDARKEHLLEQAADVHWPGRVTRWRKVGIPMVIGERSGYHFHDLAGRRYLDCHLNGGTYNLGHRNPEVVAALRDALDHVDIGNHHFPSIARTETAALLSDLSPWGKARTLFTTSGADAADLAIKTARQVTGRRTIVGMTSAYHGHTGLAFPISDPRAATYFHSEAEPDSVRIVPYDDTERLAAAFEETEVAAVLVETIPATAGFHPPSDDYLRVVRELCDTHGALYVADEVQTGLGRSGAMWAVEHYGVVPDILITGKGLSGGIYPIAAMLAATRHTDWLLDRPYAHSSTFGGAELGCVIAKRVLEITTRPETVANVSHVALTLREALADVRAEFPELRKVNQVGLIMSLTFDRPQGGVEMMRQLARHGVWCISAGFDPTTVQFKPGLLWTDAHCEEVVDRLRRALSEYRDHPESTAA